MLTVAEVTLQAMVSIVQTVAVGTNMGLLRILWVMVNGSLLSRVCFVSLDAHDFQVGIAHRTYFHDDRQP